MAHVVIDSGRQPERRVGIYALGGCDLRVVLGCAPLIAPTLKGVCGILDDGLVSEGRSDLQLQSLNNYPAATVAPIAQRLRLPDGYFRPRLFAPSFVLPRTGGPALEFPKTVVVLSIGSDLVRTVYRHRPTGVRIDPGGSWLDQSVEPVLKDPTLLAWFREQFVSLGRISLEESVANFTTIIRRLQADLKTRVLVFNALTVDPGSQVHNYQFVRGPHALRRREFNLALVEMSRRLDFSIVDVDRVVKRAGVREQVDFGHAAPAVDALLAQEVFRVIRDLGVL